MKYWVTFELWVTLELWVTFELWVGGQTDKHTDTHQDRQTHQYHDSTLPRAGPSDNMNGGDRQMNISAY